MNNKEYVVQLDGLRFFAVLMVMFAHWMQWQWTNPILTNLPFNHGVTLFFVLSGFLISNILLKNKIKYNESNQNKFILTKNFYIRRVLRIFPIYYITIFFLYCINYNNTHEIFPWLVSYTPNIYQSINNVYIGDFSHFWSLGVEEQFYLFWPLLILFINPKFHFRVILLVIISALISKVFFFIYIDNWMANSYFTLNCMNALGLGALIAYFSTYKKELFKKLSKFYFVYISVTLYLLLLYINYKFQIKGYKEVIDEFLFAITSGLIIIRASGNNFKFITKYILENKFIVYSGKISYGLYVYHLFMPSLFYYIAPRIGLSIDNKYTSFVLFYLLTFLIAHISWKLIENPINNLKYKFPYFVKK